MPFNIFSDSKSDLLEALKKEVYLVDVRTSEEFVAGSVPNAINIPLNQVPDELESFKGKKNIIVFCQSGARSGQAKRFLIQNGIEDVLNGGNWKNLGNLIE